MKKNILAPAVALSLGLAGALGVAAPAAFAETQPAEKPTFRLTDPENNDITKLTSAEYKNPGASVRVEGAKKGTKYVVAIHKAGETPENYTNVLTISNTTKSDGELETITPFSGTGRAEDVGIHTIVVYAEDERTELARFELEVTDEGVLPDEEEPGEGDGTAPPAPGDEENPEQPGDGEGDGGDDTGEGEGDDQQPGEGDDDQQPGEGDDAEAKDPALNLSEKKVTAVDFVNKKKGVVATVSGLEPGTKVTFYVGGVTGNAKDVRPFKQTVEADKDGNAILAIAGTTSTDNPSAYLGKYKVTAEFDDQKLEDSFEVVSGKSSDAGESEESGSGGGSVSGGASDKVSDSGTLPRTGQGLGGLAAGAALLTVGGAAVLLTRRTRKA